MTNTDIKQQARTIKDAWSSSHDNTFARNLFRQINWPENSRPELPESRLCSDCQRINFQKLGGFRLDAEQLRQKSNECDFCDLCYKSSEIEKTSDTVVRFKPTNRTSLLSVYTDPGKDNTLTRRTGHPNHR